MTPSAEAIAPRRPALTKKPPGRLPAGRLEAELARFPSREVCEANCAFALEYRRHIDGLLAGEWREGRRDELLQISEEAFRLWDVWGDLRIARSYGSPHALRRVRRAVGEEAYWEGRLPPHVPVWRFRRID